MHDYIQEVTPASGVMLGIIDFLAAEAMHGSEVIAEFLIFKSWNCNFSQINDKVIANDLVVFDIAFEFSNLIKHGLNFSSLFSRIFEQTFECKLALIHLINGFLLVFDLFYGIHASGLNSFFARDSLYESLKLHKLTLDPISHVFEWILDVFSLDHHIS